uniref:Uncharacterized protein n=1 Tax=Caenorhabditis tropicalis TaxID=1561998 RepID=A0A1I7UGY5_9PELO
MPPKKQKSEPKPVDEMAEMRAMMEKMMIGINELKEEVGKIKEKVEQPPLPLSRQSTILSSRPSSGETPPQRSLESLEAEMSGRDPVEEHLEGNPQAAVVRFMATTEPSIHYLPDRQSQRIKQRIQEEMERRERMAELDNTLTHAVNVEERETKLSKQQKKAQNLFKKLEQMTDGVEEIVRELDPAEQNPQEIIQSILQLLGEIGQEPPNDPREIPPSLRFTPIPDDTPIQQVIVGCHWALVEEEDVFKYLKETGDFQTECNMYSRLLEFELHLEDLTLKNPRIQTFNTYFFNAAAGQFDVLSTVGEGITCSIVDNKIYTHNYTIEQPDNLKEEIVEKITRQIKDGLLVLTYEMAGSECARKFARVKLF